MRAPVPSASAAHERTPRDEHDLLPAVEPDDLERFLVERVNAGDVEGLVALFEPDAVLAFPPGKVTTGSDAIRQVFSDFVASGVKLTLGDQRPTLRVGDLALTSTRPRDRSSVGGI